MFPKNNTPRWVIIAIDLIISALSLTLAYLIRFDIMADKAIWKTELGILFKFIWVFFLSELLFFIFLVSTKELYAIPLPLIFEDCF